MSNEKYLDFIKQYNDNLARCYAKFMSPGSFNCFYTEPHVQQKMCMSSEEFAKHVPYMTIRI